MLHLSALHLGWRHKRQAWPTEREVPIHCTGFAFMHYINRCIYSQASQAYARRRRCIVLGALASSVIISLRHRRVAAFPLDFPTPTTD
jgi:hypothetical protein